MSTKSKIVVSGVTMYKSARSSPGVNFYCMLYFNALTTLQVYFMVCSATCCIAGACAFALL